MVLADSFRFQKPTNAKPETVSSNNMKFTKVISDKIEDAWQYNSASTCQWAMFELDKFVDELLNDESVEVENENITFNSLSDFVIWKNKKWILGQISICNNKTIQDKIYIINTLIHNLKVERVKFNETDPNNHRFHILLTSNSGKFQIYLGKVSDIELLPAYTIEINSINFSMDNQIDINYKDGQKRNFKFEFLEIK